jgi:hypothetical protein
MAGTQVIKGAGGTSLAIGSIIGSATAGSILFAGVGGALSQDNANLFWDDTNNRLGIGTNTPTATGHFKGSGTTVATTSLLVHNSAGISSLVVDDNLSVYNAGRGTKDRTTAFGLQALMSSITGFANTCFGNQSLKTLTDGTQNVAVGTEALKFLTTGFNNSAIGYNSMLNAVTSGRNVAIGVECMRSSTNAQRNIAIGELAMYNSNGGNDNVVIGYNASSDPNGYGNSNTIIGTEAMNTGLPASSSIAIGRGATITASNQFVVGSLGYNAGTVAPSVAITGNVWNVIINGVARQILLA